MTNKYGAIYEYSEGRKVKNLLPMLKEAGIDILNTVTPPPAGDIGLAEVKQEVGDRICLRGYIEAIPVIEKGAPASICEAVREAILTAAIGGGFIIGTTQQPITVHTAEENIRAFFQSVGITATIVILAEGRYELKT